MTTGKRAERTKLDFRYPICRSAIGQSSCLICAQSSTDVPVLLLNHPHSSIRRKRLAVAFDNILLVYRDLPLPPNVQTYCFYSFKVALTKQKLQNLNRKIDLDVYCYSFKVISTESPSTRKFGTFYDFLPISHYFSQL